MKKIICIILGCTLCFALSACGNTDSGKKDNGSSAPANQQTTAENDKKSGGEELVYDGTDAYVTAEVEGGVAVVEFRNTNYTEYDKITVPAEIDGKKVVSIGVRGNDYKVMTGVVGDKCEVVLPDTVEYIAPYAFMGASGLVRLSGGAGCNEIDEYAFINCENLKEITFLDSVDKIADSAFAGCESFDKNS